MVAVVVVAAAVAVAVAISAAVPVAGAEAAAEAVKVGAEAREMVMAAIVVTNKRITNNHGNIAAATTNKNFDFTTMEMPTLPASSLKPSGGVGMRLFGEKCNSAA